MKNRMPGTRPRHASPDLAAAVPSFIDRRTTLRKACSFDVQITTKAGPIKGIGLEISSDGLAFIMPRGPGGETLDIVALIRSHKIALTVKIVRNAPMSYQLETWFKLACTILVPVPEWNTIINETLQGPVSRSAPPAAAKAAPLLSAAKTAPSASVTGEVSFGALPGSAQQSIIAQLVDLKRLAQPRAGHAPLVRVTLGPEYRDVSGKAVHRYRVHSRIVQHAHTRTFETIFLVSERGEVTLER